MPISSTAPEVPAIDYLLGILDAAPPLPVVVVVGDRSRTSYADCVYLGEILAAVASRHPDAVIRHAGKLPFDELTARVTNHLGVTTEFWGPEPWRERLEPYDRDPGMVHGAAVVIALPRVGTETADTADFMIAAVAAELGVPVVDFVRP
jgi:hypothetical protein